jgi:hypothetical protein
LAGGAAGTLFAIAESAALYTPDQQFISKGNAVCALL